ncbi:helix-turn-helix domain-containing protein [Sporosarcina sp. G11-34]|nr:helix-turn-helix domain-containing protein [Sporosarcina sp. G11-34]
MQLGDALKLIRTNKGLSQSKIASGIISTSFYSKVEKNLSNISTELLFKLLEQLNISLDEFWYIYNDYSLGEKEELTNKCKQIYLEGNINELIDMKDEVDNIYEETQKKFYQRLSIVLYCAIQNVKSESYDDKIVEPLKQYLLSINTWGYYEIKLFGICILVLEMDINTLLLLANQLLNNLRFYSDLQTYEKEIITVLIRIVETCLNNDRLEEADYYLNIAKRKLTTLNLMFEKNLLEFLSGISLMQNGNVIEGKKMAVKSIDIFKVLNMKVSADKYEKYFKKKLYTVEQNINNY